MTRIPPITGGFVDPDPFFVRPTLRGHFGMCASTHWVASSCAQTTSMSGSFWRRQWTPVGAVVEDRLGDGGTRAGDWGLGRLSCVTRDPASGLLAAAANPRGAQGYAVGR